MKDKQFTIFYQEGEGGSGAYYTGNTIEELVDNFAKALKQSLPYYVKETGCDSFEIKLADINNAEDSSAAHGEDIAEAQYKVGDVVLVDVGGHTSVEGKITDVDKETDNGVPYYRYYINFNENESENKDDDGDNNDDDDDEINGYYDTAEILYKVR